MTISVLVVTPSEGFGELIRQTLEEESNYQVSLVERGEEATALAKEKLFDLAILDHDPHYASFEEIGRPLLEMQPDLRLIVVPPRNNPHHHSLGNLTPHGYLPKPFYLPNLLELVEKTLQAAPAGTPPPSPPAPEAGEETAPAAQPHPQPPKVSTQTTDSLPSNVSSPEPAPPWLQDVNRAAQHLTRLSLETAAQAALITAKDQLYAYAGGYSENVARELADAVNHHWGRQGGSDLARFIRLEATGEEYMLYATALPGDMVLSLVFDAKTPFSQIRSQASYLAQALSSGLQPEPQPPTTDMPTQSAETVHTPDLPLDWLPDQTILDDALEETGGAPLLDDIPSDWRPTPPASPRPRSYLDDFLPRLLPAAPMPYEDEQASAEKNRPSWIEAFDDENFTLEETVPSSYAGRESAADTQQETRPSPTPPPPEAPPRPAEPAYLPLVEPVLPSEPTPAVYNLSFACVMIPRFPHHFLTSDLAARLSEWLPQICVAFGWRVEHLSVRPEYVQFMVNVPPATSPGYLMRILTKVTSQRIFASFPRFQEENPSGEFWAPGYLIISSTQLPPHRMVKDFISQTRKRQGFK